MARSRIGSVAYWTLAIVLTVFGFVDLIAIGAPFLLTGVAMLVLGHRRRDRVLFWPPLVGIWLFVLGFVLTGPLGCTSSGAAPSLSVGSGVAAPIVGHTTCTNVLGIDYSGGMGYQPPLLPALLAGLAIGLAGAIAARWLLRREASTRALDPR